MELDKQVAEALGLEYREYDPYQDGKINLWITKNGGCPDYVFSPSTNWSQGGPLIEEHEIEVKPATFISDFDYVELWQASIDDVSETGPTPLIAAMKALVAKEAG